jgi:uncharacterized membrane protein HdeD (DUF308 family)
MTEPEGTPITGSPERPSKGRVAAAAVALLMGAAAGSAPLLAPADPLSLIGVLIVGCGLLEWANVFPRPGRKAVPFAYFSGNAAIGAGLVLIFRPLLLMDAVSAVWTAAFVLDGLVDVARAVQGGAGNSRLRRAARAVFKFAVGAAVWVRIPGAGEWTVAIAAGLRLAAAGRETLAGKGDYGESPEYGGDSSLPAHAELTRLRTELMETEGARLPVDAAWGRVLLLSLFVIHVSRMQSDWTMVGLLSPAVATAGDVFCALVIAFAVVLPLRTAWRALTRPLERRAWAAIPEAPQAEPPGPWGRLVRRWLRGRVRFSVRMRLARESIGAAIRRGLKIGLPPVAVLTASVPVWGFSWYFNTENWSAGVWHFWVDNRTDAWRGEMVRAARALRTEDLAPGAALAVPPGDLGGGGDFSFVVIGDPGEGDASQFALHDQIIRCGDRPEVKFLVVASDVVYPSGEMKHYEPRFFLPFKGFARPIYAVPGNHDWYDALEGFAANFFDPESARAALRARILAERRITTTTERRIDAMIAEAARLRSEYGIDAARQRAPYFHIQTDRFALIVVDTGTLRRVDADQLAWLRESLAAARGKFIMMIAGHPLFAAGRYQAAEDESFAALHHVFREFDVDLVMAGDTHDFEFYRERYSRGDETRQMLHFVNGGGGAYLSIGTALDTPADPDLPDWAFYPATAPLAGKLEAQTPPWKRPLWRWTQRFGARPFSPEFLSAAFNFDSAPFFQSFCEIRVEPSRNRVVVRPYGVHGRLSWKDLQVFGAVVPDGATADDLVEFVAPMHSAPGAPRP